MFDLGGTELLLLGIVALIVVGPKDLPGMFRAVGRFTGKARGMAREFSSAMNAAADEAGVKDIQNTIKAASNPKAYGLDKLREASGMASAPLPPAGTPLATRPPIKPGGATEALAADRAEAKRKITEATARTATERKAREAAQAAGAPAGAAAPDAASQPAPVAKTRKTRAKVAAADTAATVKPKAPRKRAAANREAAE